MCSGLTRLTLKVIPGASRNGITGWLGDSLRVRVTAAPERGKANTAVEEIVAQVLGISRQAILILELQ